MRPPPLVPARFANVIKINTMIIPPYSPEYKGPKKDLCTQISGIEELVSEFKF